jgi:hypothetical protein
MGGGYLLSEITAPLVSIRRKGDRAGYWVTFLQYQMVHILLFMMLMQQEVNLVLLTASAWVSLLLHSKLLFDELRSKQYRLTPIMFYLLATILRIGVGLLYLVAIVDVEGGLHSVNFGFYVPEQYLMEAHLILLIGSWCLLLGYFFLSAEKKNRREDLGIQPMRIYWSGFTMVVFAAIIFKLSQTVSFGGLSHLVGFFTNYGVPGGVYVMLSAFLLMRQRQKTLLIISLLVFALALGVLLSLTSYMKSAIFISMLPIVMIAVRYLRDLRKQGLGTLVTGFVMLSIVAYVSLFVVSSYSEMRRPAFWNKGKLVESPVEVMPYLSKALDGAVPFTDEFSAAHKFPYRGVWNLLKRLTAEPVVAWSVWQYQAVGERPGSIFTAIATNIIPRIVWPDKPLHSPGRDVAVAMKQARNFSQANSAIALTVQGSYYWWGGYVYLIVGCFLTGAGFAVLSSYFSSDWASNPISAMVLMSFCFQGFHWFEDAFLGAFPGYLYIVIVLIPLHHVTKRLMGYTSSDNRKRSYSSV